jgi:hypothetical protein
MNDSSPMILCSVSEHKSKTGGMYLMGFLGSGYIAVLPTQTIKKGARRWVVMLTMRPSNLFDDDFDEGESTDVKPDAKLANKDSTNP